MCIMAMPTVLLYEFSILAVAWVEKQEAARAAGQTPT
jgi:Sec-independent protein secretion pathway component TatC